MENLVGLAQVLINIMKKVMNQKQLTQNTKLLNEQQQK